MITTVTWHIWGKTPLLHSQSCSTSLILFKLLLTLKSFSANCWSYSYETIIRTLGICPIYKELNQIEQPLPDTTKKNEAGTIHASPYTFLCASNSIWREATSMLTPKLSESLKSPGNRLFQWAPAYIKVRIWSQNPIQSMWIYYKLFV